MQSGGAASLRAFATRLANEHGQRVFAPTTTLYGQCWADGKQDSRFAHPTTFTGPTEAPSYNKALVVAHGLMGSTNNFYTPGTQLTRMLDGVIEGVNAVDMRNHGRSPHTDVHSSVTLACDVAHHVQRVVDAAPVSDEEPQHVVMGHSMGGTAVMVAAVISADDVLVDIVAKESSAGDADTERMIRKAFQTFAKVVQGVIIVDVCPSVRMPGAFNRIKHDLDMLMSLEMAPTMNAKTAGPILSREIPDNMMRNFLLTNLMSGRPADGTLSKWRCNLPVLRDSLPALHFPLEAPFPAESRYSKPALFVYGDRSPYNHTAGRNAIPHFFAADEQVEIPKSNHYPHFEQRDAFCDAVAPFVRRLLE